MKNTAVRFIKKGKLQSESEIDRRQLQRGVQNSVGNGKTRSPGCENVDNRKERFEISRRGGKGNKHPKGIPSLESR